MLAQAALPAGAGIQPKPKFIDKDIEKAFLDSQPRYVFSAGEAFGLGDRHVGMPSIPQGRLALVDNYTYQCQNLSDDYIMKGSGSPFIVHTKSAAACAEEILSAFVNDGISPVVLINALTGKDPELVIELERVIVPELPATLKGLASYLSSQSVENIANANMPPEIEAVAEAARAEMYQAAVRVITFQNNYLNRTERELINSRKPNGHGKSSLDDRDRFFYKMLNRPVPKEADLEYVAEQEGEDKGQDTALAAAIEKLTNKLDSDSKVKTLEEQVAQLTKLVQKLTKSQAKESE